VCGGDFTVRQYHFFFFFVFAKKKGIYFADKGISLWIPSFVNCFEKRSRVFVNGSFFLNPRICNIYYRHKLIFPIKVFLTYFGGVKTVSALICLQNTFTSRDQDTVEANPIILTVVNIKIWINFLRP
jgi:hypothetical protein